jgi:hypothetical protein
VGRGPPQIATRRGQSVTDRERISRLEALLARVKARTDEPRPEHEEAKADAIELANGVTNGEAHLAHEEITDDDLVEDAEDASAWSRPDSQFPAESSTLQALPPPPPLSSANAFTARDSAPAVAPSAPASLEEAFEQYEMVSEVVEIAPDAEDDSVRPSVRPPIMSDEAFDEEARLRVPTPVEEFQSQQRLVVAPSVRPVSGVDEGELEVLGEADLGDGSFDDAELEQEAVMEVETDDLLARTSEAEVQSSRPTRDASEMIAQILSTGLDAPPENANRPVLELQEEIDEIEEPPPSSRRLVSQQTTSAETIAYEGAREQELTFENDPPPSPLMTPPPESGRQVALPDVSREGDALEPSVLRAKLDDNSGVAVVVAPSSPSVATTFGDLIDLALSI